MNALASTTLFLMTISVLLGFRNPPTPDQEQVSAGLAGCEGLRRSTRPTTSVSFRSIVITNCSSRIKNSRDMQVLCMSRLICPAKTVEVKHKVYRLAIHGVETA